MNAKRFLCLFLILALLLAACEDKPGPTATTMAEPAGPTAEAESLRPGKPVVHTPARDQGSVGFCWAYALTGWIEGELALKGRRVSLSPEYNGFYNLYYQLRDHLRFFRTVARRLNGSAPVPKSTMESRCVRVEKQDPVDCLARRIFA